MIRKSDLLNARRCSRLAWLSSRHRELLPALTQTELDRMRLGQKVGELARLLFPEGVMAANAGPNVNRAETTRELMATDAPAIFEGTFIANGNVAKVDILERTDQGWRLIEVKSSKAGKDFKEDHLLDVFFQAAVLREAGTPLSDVALARVNGDYVFDGAQLEPHGLFRIESVAHLEADWESVIRSARRKAQDALEAEEEPDGILSRGCRSPDFCPFYGRCHPEEPEFPLYTLPNLSVKREAELLSLGITSVDEIEDPELLTGSMIGYWSSVRQRRPLIADQLLDALERVRWPALFLDFESCAPTLPLFMGCSPFEALPFQWSAHRLTSASDPGEHLEFLASGLEDPRPAFCRSLLQTLEEAETVLHYSAFERTALKELVKAGVPEAEACQRAFESKAMDLEKLVKEHVSHPEFRGKSSIKVVLPALAPGFGYDDLDLVGGDAAQMAFYQLADPRLDPTVRAALRFQLLAYCKRDTEAMVKVFQKLCSLAG